MAKLPRWKLIAMARERVEAAEFWLSNITMDDPRFDNALAEWRAAIKERNEAERR